MKKNKRFCQDDFKKIKIIKPITPTEKINGTRLL